MKIAKKLSEFNDRNNVWLKILAVFVSVMIWLVVVNVSDPVTSTTFYGVPVEVVNGDLLTEKGKIFEMNGAGTVTVTVSAKRSILDSISKDYLVAIADMKDLNEAEGTIKLKAESNKYNEKIESFKVKEEEISVDVDNLMKRQLQITTSITGNPAKGYVIGDVGMDQNILRLSGPEKVVSRVNKVVAEVSVEGMSSNISTTVDLKLYDAQGELINSKGLTQNITSVAVRADILATKTVNIRAYASGTPAEGYGTTGNITVKPDKIVLAGKSGALKGVNDITIPAMDLSVDGATDNVKATFDLDDYLPDMLRYADSEQETEVKVEVEILKKETQDKTITKSLITVQNMPDGCKGTFELEESIHLTLIGMPEAMETLEDEPMSVIADMAAFMKEKGIEELANATYEVPLTIVLPTGVEVEGNEKFSITMRITKNE